MNDPNLAKIIGKSLALPGLLLMIWLGAKLWDIVKKRGKNALEVDTQILDHQKHKPVPSSSSAVLEGTCQRLKKVLVQHPKVTSFFIVVSLFGGLFYWGFSAENKDQQPAESATNTPISSVQQQPATPPSQASQPTTDSDVETIRKAAEQGGAVAQRNLGVMYHTGQGVPQDDKQAFAWVKKAAEQGYAKAQLEVGVMCLDGQGVPQDDKQAVAWFLKAAEQGYAMAQYNLGVMYGTGQGVPQNDVNAYVWSSLAAAQGAENAAKNRDIAAKGFTPEQRSKAQALAAELQAKIDKQKK